MVCRAERQSQEAAVSRDLLAFGRWCYVGTESQQTRYFNVQQFLPTQLCFNARNTCTWSLLLTCSLSVGLNGSLPLVERRVTTVAQGAEVRNGRPAHNPAEVASALLSGLRQRVKAAHLFHLMVTGFRKSIAVTEGSQASSFCLSSKSNM
jgi:hypothetical protein